MINNSRYRERNEITITIKARHKQSLLRTRTDPEGQRTRKARGGTAGATRMRLSSLAEQDGRSLERVRDGAWLVAKSPPSVRDGGVD